MKEVDEMTEENQIEDHLPAGNGEFDIPMETDLEEESKESNDHQEMTEELTEELKQDLKESSEEQLKKLRDAQANREAEIDAKMKQVQTGIDRIKHGLSQMQEEMQSVYEQLNQLQTDFSHNEKKECETEKDVKVPAQAEEKKKFNTVWGMALYIAAIVLLILLSVTFNIIYSLSGWVLDTWGLLSIEEIIFHLKVPLNGTNSDMVWDAVSKCVPFLILLLILYVIIVIEAKHDKKKLLGFNLAIACASLVIGGCGIYKMYDELDVKDYLQSRKEESFFIQDNYVDPRKVQIQFPEQKRNLIYIYLESMESTYSSKEFGGAYDDNYIPELTTLAMTNCSFSNTNDLGGLNTCFGSGWTMAGIFAQTSGLPIKPEGKKVTNEVLADQDGFSSNAFNLEDVLAEQGYNQCFMLGSDATFGGRRAYFESHGDCEIWDYLTAKETGKIPEDYNVWWGFEDEKLFAFAQEKLLELSANGEPFSLTMLTADTHFEDGYVCELCQNEFGDNQYANVMACSSRQINNFLVWLQQQEFYNNTTVILVGDHETMDSDFCEGLEDYERRIYNAFINLPDGMPSSYEVTRNRDALTLDMFPTTLAALGVQIEGDRLGLGTNLFSGIPTITETYGFDMVNEEFQKPSEFYQLLIDDID